LQDWERRFPGSIDSVFASLSNVLPAHLLDRQLFDFSTLKADQEDRDS
jgi:tRNA 2-thiocytidine biosynthesis protein TtcA